MKTSVFALFLIEMFCILRCADNIRPEVVKTEGPKWIPIAYEFAHLGLYLDGSLDSCRSPMYWRRESVYKIDYCGYDTAVHGYFSLDRPTFYFNGQPTGPSLFVITDQGKIKKFSAAMILYLEDGGPSELAALWDSLTMLDLLRHPHVRQSMMDHHQFKRTGEGYVEEMEMVIREENSAFDHISYQIRVHPYDSSRYDFW